ncbi:glutamine synthetase family protein [Endozoicomonas atrinae]|uniref:glutamine synthetase family protein n=1 Tax=Endozoicomonas atrinae TaxID=1333660 RepID=UPI0008257EE0|nr:glutamine synthetase family protein [Endozoicomonas atrinae]
MSVVAERLAEQSSLLVRLLWCDNANLIRAKSFHRDSLGTFQEMGIGITAACQALSVVSDALCADTGLSGTGENWLQPDWNTLKISDSSSGHAAVIADIVQWDGEPWPLCPRHFLKRMVSNLNDEFNLSVKVGFEYEFYLMEDKEEEWVPAEAFTYASDYGFSVLQPLVDDIIQSLDKQTIKVRTAHAESGPGQLEMSLDYGDALKIADDQLFFRKTVHAMARQHGYAASFLPKIFADQCGSGMHLHLSLWQEGRNILADGDSRKLSPEAEQFAAGILHHLPALTAVTTPTCNSFRRITPHCWSGAFTAWGWDNREAAIRIPSQPGCIAPSNLELKTIDASANPYLALGSIIAAGIDGLRNRMDLKEECSIDPGCMSDQEREASSIRALPEDLLTALSCFRENNVLLNAMGEGLAKSYLGVKQAENNHFSEMSLEDEVNWLLQRY